MPQFKIAKTDKKTILDNKEISEDKLYIYKESDDSGQIFYDYDNEKRIRLGGLTWNDYY